MKEQKLSFLQNIDNSWTLFLDRDGVINKRIENGYVLNLNMFEFIDGVLESLSLLSEIFRRIIVVTNQRAIGKGLMTEEDLKQIHNYMLREITSSGGRIDAIFYCPHDYEKEICSCRKPSIGMALKAKRMFPDIEFKKSIVVGDSQTDMEFAKNIGAVSVYVGNENLSDHSILKFKNLKDFSNFLLENLNSFEKGEKGKKK